jgi:hypothetical protein
MAHLTTRHISGQTCMPHFAATTVFFSWVPGISVQFWLCHWTQAVERWLIFNALRLDLTAGLPLLVTSLRPHHLSTSAWNYLFPSLEANKQDSGDPAELFLFM